MKLSAFIKKAIKYSQIGHSRSDSTLWLYAGNELYQITSEEITKLHSPLAHTFFVKEYHIHPSKWFASGRVDKNKRIGSIFIGYRPISVNKLKDIVRELKKAFRGVKFFVWDDQQIGDGVPVEEYISGESVMPLIASEISDEEKRAKLILDIEEGDLLLGGKFKNKKVRVKEIGVDDLGQPTVNGKPILKVRINKLLPDYKRK